MQPIIYEDENIIVYNKPAGILTQADRSFDVDVVSKLMTYLATKERRAAGSNSAGKNLTGSSLTRNNSLKRECPEVHVINRLDRPVSGLVLLAKNKEWAAKLSKELTSGNISKDYLAVVQGVPEEMKGHLMDYLVKDGKNNISLLTDSKDKEGKKAELEYEVIAHNLEQGISLVKIHLLTGRHHQIRVQFASRGLPLLGDVKYSNLETKTQSALRERKIALCAYHLSVLDKEFTIQPEGYGFEYFTKELETLLS